MNNPIPTPGNPAQNPATDAPHGENALGHGFVNRYKNFINLHHVDSLVEDAKKLIEDCLVEDSKNYLEELKNAEIVLDAAKNLQAVLTEKLEISEKHEPQRFKINPPRRVSLDDIIKQRNQERGLEPLPLEPELLLKRIASGGHSGQFLGDAFLSAYRPDWQFHYSLFDLIKLDAEGFRLFHQILHIRHVTGWNDDILYQIEQQILEAMRGGAL